MKIQESVTAVDQERTSARLNQACIVCGSANPRGLQLNFKEQQAGTICAEWTTTDDWESFQGTIHGGIIATVLDEAMSKAVIAREWEALTVDMRVRFRVRVSPGQRLRVCGWVIDRQRRKILAEAVLTTVTGTECAHAWATFLPPHND
jgi:acyl-coenzyme A thioesterase PaaI-like protein